MNKIIIFGAGSGGKEILRMIINDINNYSPTWDVVAFIDKNIQSNKRYIDGIPILDSTDKFNGEKLYGACSNMDNKLRKNIIEKEIEGNGITLTSLIHPSAKLYEKPPSDSGCIIFPGVKIGYNVELGKGVVISYNNLIGHDISIGDFSFIGPSCSVCARSRIGNNVTLGVGANLIPDSIIGNNSIVGAGTTILSKVNDNTSVISLSKIFSTKVKD